MSIATRSMLCMALAMLGAARADAQRERTWTADNGNGTFSNPLFYDEFSDPDLIRVGDDFYLTGTTMHAMPGLPVLHSRDLVNWELMSYAVERLDLAPKYRLEGGEIYGQGIWAPSFRYHKGVFHIFTNVNGQTTQHFTANNPRGPWTRTSMKGSLHDLSVLFDDDDKAYVVWGYQDMHFAQLDSALIDIVAGSERVLFPKDAGMGEGAHFYKIDGKYFIMSAWFAGRMRLAAARADRREGPYEVNKEISADETFGLRQGFRVRGNGNAPDIVVTAGNPTARGTMSLHQGGIVRTPAGEWWGFSMMDANSVGRLTALSPVTWKNGWPYFGLPGNLERTPRIWVKPKTTSSAPRAPYMRNDEFSGPRLANVWQWNHAEDDAQWSLNERRGFLRLHSMPAADFWTARNSLTQRAVGPQSSATTALDASGMRVNDVAGLALLNRPYAWVGVRRTADGLSLEQYDQTVDSTASTHVASNRVWLRADADFLTEQAHFSYSTNGTTWTTFGRPFTMAFQLKTFQGVRFALFHYNTGGAAGGVADFDFMHVDEPHPRGLMRPIPVGRTIALKAANRDTPFVVDGRDHFTIVDRGLGRVALRLGARYVSITTQSDNTSSVSLRAGSPRGAETFQWMENLYGDVLLMSLSTHRYLRVEPDGRLTSDSHGPEPDPADGTALRWNAVESLQVALREIVIPNADDVRGNVTLPTSTSIPRVSVTWRSSNPAVVSDRADGPIAAGVVTRPPVGARSARVTLRACASREASSACRTFMLTVRPAVRLAEFTRYGMVNFARSNSQDGQQIYMAASVGNDALRWIAVNDGRPVLESTKGMHGVRDPSLVRSPDGDTFFLIATDLNVDAKQFGWEGWDWAQSGASRYIEVWRSTDLRHWAEQRHVLVAPEEAGMAFAPEAIWDPSIGAYVVYWTSSVYAPGTHFTTDRSDPNRRFPVTRNQTLYTTTRDFVTFTPPRVMIDRPNHGVLDAVIIRDDRDGTYHRFVTDRISTGVGTTKYVPSCSSEDVYQERASSILAPPEEWELVASCITHDAMNTTYAEAPMVVKANPGDVHGSGVYFWADQKWPGSPAGNPMEEQLHPYWGKDLASGKWTPMEWMQKPQYDLARGVLRHGNVFALTAAEHAALRSQRQQGRRSTPPRTTP